MHSRVTTSAVTSALGAWRLAEAPVGPRVPARDTATSIHPLVSWAFCLMIFSFHFEMPLRDLGWQPPQITATLFLLATLLQPSQCFGRTHTALLWWLAYTYVFAVSVVWHGLIDPPEGARLFLFLVQALFVCWAGFNLWQYDDIARKALWWFVIGSLLRALLPLAGIGRTGITAGRLSAFGQDPNTSAVLLAAALVILIGLTYGPVRSRWWLRLLAWPFAALLALVVVQSGSRGGLFALAAGLSTWTLLPGRLWSRVRGALMAGIAIGLLATYVEHSPLMKSRLENSAEQGAMAGREELFPASWSMFVEKPWGGWGPINNQYEVLTRAPDHMPGPPYTRADAHNLFLDLLASTGLVGAGPYLMALALCLRGAWRARAGEYRIVPLALMAVFLTGNLSLNQLTYKPFWLMLAFALACERRLASARRGDGSPER